METSIFIARLFGPVLALVGAALLFKPEAFRVLLKEFIESHVLVYLAGFLGLVVGLALVLTHNIWVFNWRLIITLFGWITLFRAVITIFQPQQIVWLGSQAIKYRGIFVSAAVLDLVIGLSLSYFGYSALLLLRKCGQALLPDA